MIEFVLFNREKIYFSEEVLQFYFFNKPFNLELAEVFSFGLVLLGYFSNLKNTYIGKKVNYLYFKEEIERVGNKF